MADDLTKPKISSAQGPLLPMFQGPLCLSHRGLPGTDMTDTDSARSSACILSRIPHVSTASRSIEIRACLHWTTYMLSADYEPGESYALYAPLTNYCAFIVQQGQQITDSSSIQFLSNREPLLHVQITQANQCPASTPIVFVRVLVLCGMGDGDSSSPSLHRLSPYPTVCH